MATNTETFSLIAGSGDGVWHLQLLGGLSGHWGEQTLTRFRSQKIATLFAYLALFVQRAHPREELADLLWPDSEVESARSNLRTGLASLRRQLEGPGLAPPGAVLLAEGRAFVRLNPQVIETDIARFETALRNAAADPARGLEEAVAAYGGPLLPGFEDAWAQRERERLQDAYVSALERLSLIREQAGDAESAMELARRAVTIDALREEAHAAVIRLLVGRGERAAAEQQYTEMARLLREKLNIEPSPGVRALLAGNFSVSRGEGGAAAGSTFAVASTGRSAPAAPPVNLPPTISRFFGRDTEIRAIAERLCSSDTGGARLLTLTGPGGSGKTRLSIEAARRLAAEGTFTGGVHFAPLADLRESERIPEAITVALGLPRQSDAKTASADPLGRAVAALAARPGPVLLVLDNAEHLVDATADVVFELLSRAPQVSLLVTSRQRLGLDGEQELPVEPLPVPLQTGAPAERLMEFPSIQLFVHRAQQVRPDFPFNARNADSVAALCTRLEGIPLALEIAASWSQVLTPAQMMERLDERLDFQVSRRRDLPSRHETLRAAVQWGYDLMPPEGRRFFARLSVFRGGWSLEAAEAVTGDPDALLHLSELRDRSFVIAVEEAASEEAEAMPQMRYRMLETLREFAEEQLSESERAGLRERHAQYFGDFAREVGGDSTGKAGQREQLRRLEAEYDNLRATQDWWTEREQGEGLLGLVKCLWLLWIMRGYAVEGLQRAERALQIGTEVPPLTRAWACFGTGHLARYLFDFPAAERHYSEAKTLFEEVGRTDYAARSLSSLGAVAVRLGDYERGRACYTEALAIHRAIGDASGTATVLDNIGSLLIDQGKAKEAIPMLEEALAAHRTAGSLRLAANALCNLGSAQALVEQYDRAIASYEEGLAMRREMGEDARAVPIQEGLATTLRWRGTPVDRIEARRLYEECLAFQERAQDRGGSAYSRLNLGLLALAEGDKAEARERLEDAVRITWETGDRRTLCFSLQGMAYLAATEGKGARTARLWGAAEALRDAMHITPGVPELREEEHYRALLTQSAPGFDAVAFDAARREGREMPLEEAVRFAQESSGRRVG